MSIFLVIFMYIWLFSFNVTKTTNWIDIIMCSATEWINLFIKYVQRKTSFLSLPPTRLLCNSFFYDTIIEIANRKSHVPQGLIMDRHRDMSVYELPIPSISEWLPCDSWLLHLNVTRYICSVKRALCGWLQQNLWIMTRWKSTPGSSNIWETSAFPQWI